MIESVLNLGIKGADLVISQLEKIAEEKEKFSRPSNVSINGAQNAALPPGPGQKTEQKDTKAQGILKSILDAIKAQKDALAKGLEGKQKTKQTKDEQSKPQTSTDDDKKKEQNENLEKLGQSAKTAVQGLATLNAGGALQAAAASLKAIPFVGEYAAAAGTAIVTAAQSFRDNVENAARVNLDTVESRSRISNITQGVGEGFTGRVDLDLNSQRALAESLGEKFGVVQKPLQDAIKELYKDKNGKAVDINQAGQLAQGNFSALGTDKGFFLQKIADQLQGLPPTFKQAMEASLLKNVTKEEQFTESSEGARSIVTQFDNDERRKAAEIATPEATKQALQINGLLKNIDSSLNNGFSNLLTGLNVLSKSIQTKSVDPLIDYARGNIGRPN